MTLSHALRVLRDDVRAIFRNDPAARNLAEVLLYPGLHAIVLHRAAHALWRRRIPFLPRLVSQYSRFLTGIEIHPGARIGRGFFIDHGMGVVVGETTVIGDWVMLYQGVTLGGTGKQQGKRHPTLEDHVVVGVGALVLGAITLHTGARIGGGAVVVKDVPPHATAVGVPARIVATRDPATGRSRRGDSLPDPEGAMLRGLHAKIMELELRMSDLEEVTHTRHAEHHLAYDALPPSLWSVLEDDLLDIYCKETGDEEYQAGLGI
ncbi:MAG: serine O-acetyltransferase [Candidatus Viridilinea halotolerans]|uniref:Serine acetyltransferase n=1 Tax=Candidatus Viridilinea halotolerans TaxID=2491704 RepID=A0A426U1X7_9CHLR|nr:MAG: serine O-acetyltransferase [Candidatus Viridilinea halotolerans]